MALKSSFKCNYKPYWLLKEREGKKKKRKQPSVACTGESDPVDRARKAFGIFTATPGRCSRQCVTSIFSAGQP